MELKFKVSAPKDVEKALLKMFGLDGNLVESLVIECFPGELPMATARIYASSLPVESPTIDEMVEAAKVRLARFIKESTEEARLAPLGFAEIAYRANLAVDSYIYVANYTLNKLDEVQDCITFPVHGEYFPSYAFGTPPSMLDNKTYQQKKY